MNFLGWLYPWGVNEIWAVSRSVLLLIVDAFSLEQLLGTLFAPWRRDLENPAHASLAELVRAFLDNSISRLFGMTVRLATLAVGGAVIVLAIVFGLPLLGSLIFAPLTLPLEAVASFILLLSPGLAWVAIVLWLLIILCLVILIALYRESLDFPPLKTPLAEAVKNPPSDWSPYLVPELRRAQGQVHFARELTEAALESPAGRFLLTRLGLPATTFVSDNDQRASGELILAAAQLATERGHERIEVADIVSAAVTQPAVTRALEQTAIKPADLDNVAGWLHAIWQEQYQPNPLLSPAHLRTTGGVGRDWAAGYTRLLEEVGTELTEQVANLHLEHRYLAHHAEIDILERVLARSGRENALLVGEPGVGKETIVWGLSDRIYFGQSLRPLAHKRVFSLDVSAILTAAAGTLEQRLVALLNEAVSAGNIILFIDGIERLLGSENGELGTIDASSILLPYLNSHRLQLIGTTSPSGYHHFVERRAALEEALEKIEVNEPSAAETITIALEAVAPIERRLGIFFTYAAIKETVSASQRYVAARRFPQKALDLLEEIAIYASSDKHISTITPAEVDELLAQKTKQPVGAPQLDERSLLLNLEETLHRRLINQDEAIGDIASALRRARSGVGATDRPIGSFLMLGPTGVGKTETAKALAKVYFGSEQNLVRLDMSEFQTPDSVERLIGETGQLTTAVREHPFTLLLLDEIEKADRQVLDLLLQVLDEGHLTDTLGAQVDFTNAIIIATSNAGSNLIRRQVEQDLAAGQATDLKALRVQLLDFVQNENFFKPEFLNRFDAVVAYRPLMQKELEQVVGLLLADLNARLTEKGVSVSLTPAAVERLAQIGFDPQSGARALARALRETVENTVAERLLAQTLNQGETLSLDAADIK